jgi:hypothetical protein
VHCYAPKSKKKSNKTATGFLKSPIFNCAARRGVDFKCVKDSEFTANSFPLVQEVRTFANKGRLTGDQPMQYLFQLNSMEPLPLPMDK